MEDGWLLITTKAGKKIEIPRAPFEHWALRRHGGKHLATHWETISRAGFKMVNDDPYHTDWVIGAGLDIDKIYLGLGKDTEDAIDDVYWQIQHKMLNFECAVLSKGEYVTGTVIHPGRNQEVPTGSIIAKFLTRLQIIINVWHQHV